jgi:hypothetical protein
MQKGRYYLSLQTLKSKLNGLRLEEEKENMDKLNDVSKNVFMTSERSVMQNR